MFCMVFQSKSHEKSENPLVFLPELPTGPGPRAFLAHLLRLLAAQTAAHHALDEACLQIFRKDQEPPSKQQ